MLVTMVTVIIFNVLMSIGNGELIGKMLRLHMTWWPIFPSA